MVIGGKTPGCFTVFCTVALASCGGGSDSQPNAIYISGQVIDGITGIPVENALVVTSPPTEARLTDRDGYYEIRDTVAVGNIYDVTARQVGYDSDTRRIGVDDGMASIADFSIVTAINGLTASVPTLEIPLNKTSSSFLLSSTIPDTNFSFTSSDPAFSIEPAQGILTKNQHVIIQVMFAADSSDAGRVSGVLQGATDNGGTGVTINVFGNVPEQEVTAPKDPFEQLLN